MAEISTLARPYAKASFEIALGKADLAKWSAMLSVLTAVTLDEKVSTVLSNPQLTASSKVSFLADICKEELNPEGITLLNALAENGRLPLIAEISAQFEQLKADQEKSVNAIVTSAFDLTDAQTNTLREKLTAKLGRDVSITTVVDQSIIGGVVIRAGDLVIDASVTGKLAKLAEAMNS